MKQKIGAEDFLDSKHLAWPHFRRYFLLKDHNVVFHPYYELSLRYGTYHSKKSNSFQDFCIRGRLT